MKRPIAQNGTAPKTNTPTIASSGPADSVSLPATRAMTMTVPTASAANAIDISIFATR
jgi:hypothetical protein